MSPSEEERLIDRLRKIEALFARTNVAGERVAAENARERILARLRHLEQSEAPVEYRFSMADGWSRSLFIALLRRYGLKPYRYPGQRRTTVMVRVTKTFVNDVLWPEFQQLNECLCAHLQSVTQRVIAQAIHGEQADLEEHPGRETGSPQAPGSYSQK